MPSAPVLPPISTALLAEVERAAVELGVPREQMTEAAARAAAMLVRRLLENRLVDANVVALVGTGVKAAVAMHTLRLLHGFGCDVSAVLTGGEREMRPQTARAAALLEQLGVPLLQPRSPAVRGAVADAAAVIDGLVGVGLDGAPREPHATLVRLCNEVKARVLSLETPTGLQPDTGEPLAPTLRATATLALGLPVAGLLAPAAWQHTGEVWLCDVGYPLAALDEARLEGDGLFAQSDLLRLR